MKMGKVTVQESTTKNPLELIGMEAGQCWGSDITDKEKNIKRGKSCLKTGHLRTAEFPQVYLTISGYSARVLRELYTHIGGSPTRLQASTRYINYGDFDYITPPSISAIPQAASKYNYIMYQISDAFKDLITLGVPQEDVANILPLGMTSTMVLRTNCRNLIDMSHQRMCTRAYWEYRQLMKDICNALSAYSEEWKFIADNYFEPKCELYGYCTEAKSCGRKPKQENQN
jgi:thymidylate synthase (FAD)